MMRRMMGAGPRGKAATAVATMLILGACARPAAPASTQEYQSILASAGGSVSAGLAGIAKATTLKSLAERLARAEGAAGEAVERLGGVTPPEAVRAEHVELVQAVKRLNGDLGDLRDAVEGRELCAPVGVMARLRTAEGLAAVRAAGEALVAKGHDLGLVVPDLPKEQTRRLGNGELVRKGSLTGEGELVVDNGTDQDTVITLSTGTRPAFAVYVRKGSKSTVRGIRDGSYRVFYTTGVDWDRKAKSFTRDCAFQRFDDPLGFRTTASQTSVWTVGLKEVPGGNASATPVDPEEFVGP